MKRLLLPFAFALNAGLTLLGFAVLLDAPYTGLRVGVRGDRAVVRGVDQGSPADGLIRAGDELRDVAGLGARLSATTFDEDPDYLRQERDLQEFWRQQHVLQGVIARGQPLAISIDRDQETSVVTVVPGRFPALQALARTVPIYLVGWTFLLVAFLAYRKNKSEAPTVFLLVGALVCVDWAVGAPFTERDLAFPWAFFRLLSGMDLVSSIFLAAAFVHLALVFPRRILPPQAHAFAVPALYGAAALLLGLRWAGGLEDTYLTSYLLFTGSLVLGMLLYVGQYVLARSTLARRQIKWVVLSTLVSSGLYVGASALPAVLGTPFVSVALSGLAFVLIPLSFAFAITRYRLMEIDGILDTTVVYAFTIVVLAGLELAFLDIASPQLVAGRPGLPYLSVAAVLLIVFAYVPVRDRVRGVVERLFRRGRYDVEQELRRLSALLLESEGRSALDGFASFVEGLLKPSGLLLIEIEQGAASVLLAGTKQAKAVAGAVLGHAPSIWEELRQRGRCTFGFALGEARATAGPSLSPALEDALFVPFVAGPGEARSGCFAVLLQKWNRTAYSSKDVTLLNAISINVASLAAAEELRRQRTELEERYRREKEQVMRELHDGLGGLLTGVTVTSQATEKLIDSDVAQARQLVRRIGEFSSEAVELMRTGLAVLEAPSGELEAILESVRARYAEMFAAQDLDLRLEYDAAAGGVRLGGVAALNLTRTIQEALNNVVQHAEARTVTVRLERKATELAVTIADDGKGLPSTPSAAGHGLRNLHRRAEALAGSLKITSSPGRGTRLELSVPLPPAGRGAGSCVSSSSKTTKPPSMA